MIKREELIAMRAIAICFTPFLKPKEALIYGILGHPIRKKLLGIWRLQK